MTKSIKKIREKRFYAYKESLSIDGELITYFIGLTNNNSKMGYNAMFRYHEDIPVWKEVTDKLLNHFEIIGDKPMTQLHKLYPIKRSYGKHFKNYASAEQQFIQLINDNPDSNNYNFIECRGYDLKDLNKYIRDTEQVIGVPTPDDSSSVSLKLANQRK